MDPAVTVLELQNDLSVKQHKVPLKFPRVSKSLLYIVTNQRSQLHLLQDPGGRPRSEGGDNHQEKSIFQYGVSTKVFSVTDPTGTAWEVRLLLSPSEISRLSSNYNLAGFVSTCLTTERYRKSLSSLCRKSRRHEEDVQELCRTAVQFLSCSEDDQVSDYCKNLNRTVIEKLGVSRPGQHKMEDMVVGALVALVAAELAASVSGTRSFDYKGDKEKTQEDQTGQIQELIRVFDVMAELLTVTHQGKKVQILFRNPCPDNWASGGKKLVASGETFVFGLCHKVVSLSEADSEIQFLQNLQESYDLVSVFHLSAFVEHLLMTPSWRNSIEVFLKDKDQRKEIITGTSSLAVRFFCSKTPHREAFLKEFQSQMLEKFSSAEAFLVGDEVVCAFGILVSIVAAVAAKSIVDRPIPKDDEIEVIIKKTQGDGGEGYLFASPGDLGRVKSGGKSGDVDIGGAESKIGRTNDPETDQGSISDSPKTAEPLAETPGVSTVDTDDQEIGNNNTDDQEMGNDNTDDQEIGNNNTDDQEIGNDNTDDQEMGNDNTDDQGIGNDNTDENFHKYPGDRGVGSVESKIGRANNAGTTGVSSINSSPKTTEPPAVDQDLGNSNADPGARDYAEGRSPTIPEIEEGQSSSCGLNLDGSNDVGVSRVAPLPIVVGALFASPGVWGGVKSGGKNGDVDIGGVESKIGRTIDQGITDQNSINGSPKTAEPLAEPPGVGTLDTDDQGIGNNKNENFHKHPETKDIGSVESKIFSIDNAGTTSWSSIDSSPKTAEPPAVDQDLGNNNADPGARDYAQEGSPTIPEIEEGLDGQSSRGGPNLENSNDVGASRVVPNVGARDKAPETQDLSPVNTTFYRSFIGLMCLLVVVVMVTTVLPQSVSSVLVAIILGLLVVKWLAGQHP